LNISAIVSAAEITEADAIHPGYGFLSENAYFAEILQDCHITFIGPSPEAVRKMGDKSLARRTVAAAGVPTVPGSPGPVETLDEDLRARMGEAAVAAARSVSYTNAGTVEFLLDSQGRFYFMEMNTRLQVEHPVTEEVTGVDIVKEQIAVAAGEPLSFGPKLLSPRGHAIEFRINAEDPYTFHPSPGRITAFHPPGGHGVRLDTAAYQGYVIPPHYDSLIAKLVVWGRNRQ